MRRPNGITIGERFAWALSVSLLAGNSAIAQAVPETTEAMYRGQVVCRTTGVVICDGDFCAPLDRPPDEDTIVQLDTARLTYRVLSVDFAAEHQSMVEPKIIEGKSQVAIRFSLLSLNQKPANMYFSAHRSRSGITTMSAGLRVALSPRADQPTRFLIKTLSCEKGS